MCESLHLCHVAGQLGYVLVVTHCIPLIFQWRPVIFRRIFWLQLQIAIFLPVHIPTVGLNKPFTSVLLKVPSGSSSPDRGPRNSFQWCLSMIIFVLHLGRSLTCTGAPFTRYISWFSTTISWRVDFTGVFSLCAIISVEPPHPFQ